MPDRQNSPRSTARLRPPRPERVSCPEDGAGDRLVAFGRRRVRLDFLGTADHPAAGHDGVVVKLLDVSAITRLRSQELTSPAGERPLEAAPPGYAHFSRTRRLADPADFTGAGQALMTWQVQARSGLRIYASSLRVELDAVIVMRLGVGAVALSIPCRVVAVIDEPDVQGFSYGSLPGHQVSGEESFLLRRVTDGAITFTVSAFSRPASRLARLGGPLSTGVQRFMTGRYLRALD